MLNEGYMKVCRPYEMDAESNAKPFMTSIRVGSSRSPELTAGWSSLLDES